MKVYGHPTCSTCKEAIRWLQAHGFEVEVKDIRLERPTAQEMKQLFEVNHFTLKQLFNTSGQLYREKRIKEQLEQASLEEAFEILTSDGMLMKRPLVIDRMKATVGFKEAMYQTAWGTASK